MRNEFCKCGNLKERQSAGQCNTCHSTYTKQWKKDHPLTDEQKEKAKITRKKYEDKKREGTRQRNPRLGARPGILRPLCSWCDTVIENFKKKNFCKPCAAKYNREWKNKNPLTGEKLLREKVRLKTYYEIKMGRLIRKPCEVCGQLKVEAHHDDYSKPFDVRWLCGQHHRDHHMMKRRSDGSSDEDRKSTDS
jgi:ribosomal protein S27AE